MKTSINKGRICVYGPGRHSVHFASIPGARWNKKFMCWTYPASPITGARVSRAAQKLGEEILYDKGMRDLTEEWTVMRESAMWKTPTGVAAAKSAMSKGATFNVKTQPWEHQVLARCFAGDRASVYYGMKMGTGKTLCIIEEIEDAKPNKTLIVCPKSVIAVWPAEFREHNPGNNMMMIPLTTGKTTQKVEQLRMAFSLADARGQDCVVIVNYETAFREPMGEFLIETEWGMIVFDEAHKIKAPGGRTSRWAAKLNAPIRRCLSGTPIPNSKLDVYGQFRFLDQGAFGTSFAKFRATYAEMGGYGGYEVIGWKNEDLFNRIIDLYMFRVDDDVLDLPPVTEMMRLVSLPPHAESIHRKLELQFITDLANGEIVSASNVLAKTMKLREICSGFVIDDDGNKQVIHNERQEALEDLLNGISEDECVVVFAEFKHDLLAVEEVASKLGRRYGEVSGRRNDLKDGAIPDSLRVLGVNPKSGGLGIQLQSSMYCVFYSVSYNFAEHEQAKARLHRGGQVRNVTYIYFVSPGTMETEIYKALIEKGDLIGAIMTYVKTGGQQKRKAK